MADELRIPKLDGNNYFSWAIRTKSILIQKDIWDAIEPGFLSETSEKQKRKDNLALSIILLTVEDSFLDDIGDCKRAIDAWQILEDIHTKYGLLHILQLLREFFNIIKGNDEDMKEYFARMMECHRKLAKCHHGFGDGELALIMLLGLPKSYEPLILSLEQQEEKLSTSVVKSKLLLEEKRQKQRQIPQEDPNSAFANIWFLDSGATEHMTSNRLKMTNTKSISTSVEMANNEKIKVSEMGDVTIKLGHEYGGETLFLENVLYVPELDGNILSVGRIEERGNKVLFQNGKASVFGSDGGLILKSNRRGRIYTVEELKIAKVKSPSADIWHRRLGHIYKRDLQNVSDTAECEVCLEGKMRRLPFPSKPVESKKTSSPLELIHSDVVGPISPMSKGGNNYVVTFIDDFTHYTTVYFMRSKSEVLERFKEYKNSVENYHSRKIKVLRSDNGTEYVNGEFNKFLNENGIKRQLTVPRTPQQNGTAERMNQTLLNTQPDAFYLNQGFPNHSGQMPNNKVFVTRNVRFREDVFPTKKIDKQISHETDFFQVLHNNFEEDYESVNEKDEELEKEDEEGQNEAAIPRGYSGTDEETISVEKYLNILERKEDEEQAYEDEELRREDEEEGQNETIIPRRSSRIAARQKEDCRSAFQHGIIEHGSHQDEIPSSYEEALNMPKVQDWLKAMECEMSSLREHRQVGIQYSETFSPVLRDDSFRTLLAFAALQNWKINHYDVETAYLYGKLEEVIYMKQPPGIEQRRNEQRVCRLNKAIYGLKQSERIWFETLTNYLIKMNFKHLGSDKCIFTFETQNGRLILAFYVDDMLIISSNEYVLNEAISIIKNQFKLKKSKKLSNILGIEIRQEENFVSMNQTRYIDTILEHFGMKDSNPSPVPLDPNQDLDKFDSSEKCDQKRYQELLGRLMYLGTKTRPDIAFQLSALSRYSKDPRQIHMGALKRILRYLKARVGMWFDKQGLILVLALCIPELRAYSDANWKERSTAEVKSTSGISYLLRNNLISWASRSQEKQTGKRLKCIRNDNAPEYLSKEFKDYLEGEGIGRQLSVEYTPQQNCVAERANRTLVDMTRCFMIEGNLPETLWAELIHTHSDLEVSEVLNEPSESGVIISRKGRPRYIRTGKPGRPRKEYPTANLSTQEFSEVKYSPDPKDAEEALSVKDSYFWRKAMKEEFDSLIENKTCELVDPPKGQNVIGSKWPENFVSRKYPEKVCRLKKAIYGLKQAGIVWHEKLDTELKYLGLKQIQSDNCVYIKHHEGILLVAIYVDDLIIAAEREDTLTSFKESMKNIFKIKDLGKINYCLGIRIQTEKDGSISIDQEKCIEELLAKYRMKEAKPISTPMDSNSKLTKISSIEGENEPVKKVEYQSLIGSLIYLSVSTRPDIAYAVSSLGQFSNDPRRQHWNAAKRVLRYLKGTLCLKITYEKTNETLYGYVDADWGGNLADRKSQTGLVLFLAGGPIAWESKKQQTVALSSTESEYIALCEAGKEAVYLRTLLDEMGFGELLNEPTVLKTDNQGAQQLARNPVHHARTKHIDIKWNYIRSICSDGLIEVVHTPTQENVADILTKGLPRVLYDKHVAGFGM
ncbi:hypothetical protein LAZ67_X002013 [Cordylochernes scorpioides]|uniref:Integrase catalytic domain-containing protein n=1 Tax=Cordylochernes scorpioides TaxID=51811 RepID=A0ABY6LTH6_9ARAC|nr:hypothetical protein LAZ67_X002013 [Cordylochernes scorpioides]